MGIQNWTALVSAIVAVVATGISVYIVRVQTRRDDFELARSLHLDLTSGPVEEARNILGTVVLGSEEERNVLTVEAVRRAYFTLLWCFERIECGRFSMLVGRTRRSAAVDYLDTSIKWHVEIWVEGFGKILKELDRRGVVLSAEESQAAYFELVKQLTANGTISAIAAAAASPTPELAE